MDKYNKVQSLVNIAVVVVFILLSVFMYYMIQSIPPVKWVTAPEPLLICSTEVQTCVLIEVE